MPVWTIEILPEAQADLLALPADLQARFRHIGIMLVADGPQTIGMPHVRHLENKLWEMRMKGKSGIARAIYFTVVGKKIVVCSAFIKKSQKTPRRELDRARTRLKDYRS
jgi:phage-related protein